MRVISGMNNHHYDLLGDNDSRDRQYSIVADSVSSDAERVRWNSKNVHRNERSRKGIREELRFVSSFLQGKYIKEEY
jgi:hypothetical protein